METGNNSGLILLSDAEKDPSCPYCQEKIKDIEAKTSEWSCHALPQMYVGPFEHNRYRQLLSTEVSKCLSKLHFGCPDYVHRKQLDIHEEISNAMR
jgi:hypothetical protein